MQQSPKRLEADASVADMFVTIDAVAARPLRVVSVKGLQPIDADDPVELLERISVSRLRRDVVSRGDEMAGVQADANAPRSPQVRDDLQRLASVDDRALDGLRDAAGNGHVRADSKHWINIMAACEALFC
jgi:hypothetical protein